MAKNLIIGLDIGTSSIRLAICEIAPGSKTPRVIALIRKESRGLRRGYVVNQEEAIASIKETIAEAEKTTREKITHAIISIGGQSLESKIAEGSVVVSRADQEITDIDVTRAVEASEAHLSDITNRRILHTVPLSFKLDGKKIFGRPQGLTGSKLEVRTLFATCLGQHLDDLIKVAEKAGLEIDDIVAAPLAATFSVLTRLQKTAGCALVNIGAQTTSLVTLEEGIPISLQVFPIGSMDITNDIALGLKISLEEAEQMKVGILDQGVHRKKLTEIIDARLSDIFELVEGHLKKIGRNGLLPAGVSIIGGGGNIADVEEVAKDYLRLPAKIATANLEANSKGQIKDPAWAVAYGLCLFGGDIEAEESLGIVSMAKKTRNKFFKFLKEFLP